MFRIKSIARVQKFNSQGTFLAKWGSYGNNPNQFLIPLGIAVDNAGSVFVVDLGAKSIKKFSVNPPATIIASDMSGTQKDVFQAGEPMYATVPSAGQTVTLYVTLHKSTWNEQDALVDVSSGCEIQFLPSSGTQTLLVWSSSLPGVYDLVLDSNNNGVFDFGDRIDQGNQINGIFVVPEYFLGGLAALGACFVGFAVFKKRSSLPSFKRQ